MPCSAVILSYQRAVRLLYRPALPRPAEKSLQRPPACEPGFTARRIRQRASRVRLAPAAQVGGAWAGAASGYTMRCDSRPRDHLASASTTSIRMRRWGSSSISSHTNSSRAGAVHTAQLHGPRSAPDGLGQKSIPQGPRERNSGPGQSYGRKDVAIHVPAPPFVKDQPGYQQSRRRRNLLATVRQDLR